jgi:hypothetical protein
MCPRLVARPRKRKQLAAHDPPFLLGIDHATKPVQEPIGCVDITDVHVQVAIHHGEHALGLRLAEQPVVDEYARQLVSDRAVHQDGGHSRVDSSRKRADDPSASHLRPDALDRAGDE